MDGKEQRTRLTLWYSCAWSGKADVSAPVGTCDIDDSPLDDPDADSGCDGGNAYMCSDNSPWAVDADLAYGYAAVSVAGGDESSWCCSCFELTFTSGPVSGKKMVVQAVNTGADLSTNQFDIAVCNHLVRTSTKVLHR